MFKKTLLALSLSFGLASVANAGIVANETTLLSGAGHQQLSTWLGEDVNLTRIFAKGVDGTTGTEWHTAVNNKGRNFTVMEIFNGADRLVIGGYHYTSWSSNNSYTLGTAKPNFLFNLTDGLKFGQNTYSSHLAFNGPTQGVRFGGGHDLYVNPTLSGGYAHIGYTYGDRAQLGNAAYQNTFTGSYSGWIVGDYETFTLSSSTGDFGSGAAATLDEQGNNVGVSDVPVSVGFGALALAGMLGFRRKTV